MHAGEAVSLLDHFLVALGAVVPIFVLVGIGVTVRLRHLLTEAEIRNVNAMVFQIFFFCMMFYNIYTADFDKTFRPQLMCFAFFGILGLFFVAIAVVCLVEKQDFRRGAMVQAIYRSNYVLLGVPLVANIYGQELVAVPMALIPVVVPLYNVLGVIILEVFRGGPIAPVPIAASVLRNPMIRGALLGLFCRVVGLPLPHPILAPLHEVAMATTPVALIVLGASIRLDGVKAEPFQLAFCTVARLVVVPAVMLTAAALLGFRGVDFVTIISIFSKPCAVAGFAMAQQMGSDAMLAGSCVIATTLFASVTVFGWIFAAKTIGFI